MDDLHLADDASIELIESMIGSRLKILLFIAFREQEVTEQIERMLNNNYANFHTLTVDTLSFESVVDYIGDALHRLHDVDRESILPLAEIIYQKTRGNAFYTKQMIITLEKKKYIFFNWEENEWDYNLAEIQNVINTKDGSDPNEELNIEFLITRLRELPADGQRILKWASFVGDTFSWNTVKYLMVNSEPESEYSDTESTPSHSTSSSQNSDIINEINNDSTHPMVRFSKLYSSRSQNSTTHNKGSRRSSGNTTRSRDPINGLQAALQEGYILPLESDEFKWSHDRYLEAAMGLADPKTRERIHFNIVQYLLQGKLSE